MSTVQKIIAVLVFILISLFAGWILFLNHTNVGYVGVAYNARAGILEIQQSPGWYVTGINTSVVYLEQAEHVVYLTPPLYSRRNGFAVPRKMVKLKIEGLSEFFKKEGFNTGESTQCVFDAYAFSGRSWPFIEVEDVK